MGRLQAFHKSVLEYDVLRDDIKKKMAVHFRKNILNHKLITQSEVKSGEGAVNHIRNEIVNHGNTLGALLDSHPDPRTELEAKTRHANYLKTNSSVSEDEAIEIISNELKLLRETTHVKELRMIREDCISKGKAPLSVLENITEEPESAL
jgi:hypothetical protein